MSLVHLDLKDDAVPKFHKPRQVPYSLKGHVECELDRFVKMNVYKPVSYILQMGCTNCSCSKVGWRIMYLR